MVEREISNEQGDPLLPSTIIALFLHGIPTHFLALFGHPEILLVSPSLKGEEREWRNNITIGSQFVSPIAAPPLSISSKISPKIRVLLLPGLGGSDKINCAETTRECLGASCLSHVQHMSALPVCYCTLPIVFNMEPQFRVPLFFGGRPIKRPRFCIWAWHVALVVCYQSLWFNVSVLERPFEISIPLS